MQSLYCSDVHVPDNASGFHLKCGLGFKQSPFSIMNSYSPLYLISVHSAITILSHTYIHVSDNANGFHLKYGRGFLLIVSELYQQRVVWFRDGFWNLPVDDISASTWVYRQEI